MKNKIICGIAAAALFMAVFAGCGNGDEGDTKTKAEAPKFTDKTLGGDKTFTIGSNDPLPVLDGTATVKDGGTVVYQWCYNTVKSTAGKTEIENADEETYTVGTSVESEFYYYVVATNYNFSADIKTASSTSNIVKVTVKNPDGPPPGATYIISGSGSTFTATKSGATVGTANVALASALSAIRSDAAGGNCTVQFGDNVNPLDLAGQNVNFDNPGGGEGTPVIWGTITITGKITASRTGEEGTVTIGTASTSASISAVFQADISNTHTNAGSTTGANVPRALTINTSGNVEIKSGTITSVNAQALYILHGDVTISGGTLTSSNPFEGGQNNPENSGVVATRNDSTLTITDGTIKNLLDSTANARGLTGTGDSKLYIYGGTIEAGTGRAIYHAGAASTSGMVYLKNTPTITSSGVNIYRTAYSATAHIEIEAPFTAQTGGYTIGRGGGNLSANTMVVKNGADYMSNFTVAGSNTMNLKIDGDNIVSQ